MKMYNLDGQTALLVGSTGNLGPIWKAALEAAGATVYATMNDVDVRIAHSIEGLKGAMKRGYGMPDIIVYNAGVDHTPGSAGGLWTEGDIMNVNYMGARRVCEAFWPELKKKHESQILFIGSMYGSMASNPNNYADGFDKPLDYGASKAALVNMAKNLAVRGAPYGIRVNVLSPAGIENDQDENFKRKYLKSMPMGRMAQPEDMKRALVGILTQTYLTGHEIVVDGGYTAW